MKNILVPTDFSATAGNAARVAFDLAADNNAALHLYSCIDIRLDWERFSAEEKEKHPEVKQMIHNTEQLFKEWIDLAEQKNIKLSTSWSGGKFIKNIIDIVAEKAIDFIVMGSHGVSGKNEYFIGSNTQRVVRAVHCPVLIIKNDLSDYKVDKVIFASNFDEKEKIAFQYLLDFTAPQQSEIHLVEINTSTWFAQPNFLVKETMKDFVDMCGDRPCKTHFFRDWSVDAGVRNLAALIGANLIAISNRQRHPLKRMTAGSNVEMLVNHAKVPVLSIDFAKEDIVEKKEDEKHKNWASSIKR